MNKVLITISRYWNNPRILNVVWGDGIAMSIDVEGFKAALKKEISSVKWVIRKATFENMVDNAFNAVITKIKEESGKAV